MPWSTDRDKRKRDQKVYGDPEYVRNRAIAKRQARGRCAQCQHSHPRLQCDHIIPTTQGGSHKLANLQMLCTGEGSCKCHERKSAQEGGGYRSKAAADPQPRPPTRW